MSGHTPGPWLVENNAVNAIDISAGPEVIATIWSQGDVTTEDEANARLIASAPDLLEMCKMMAAEFSNQDGVFFERHPAIGRLIDVIAKAEGKS